MLVNIGHQIILELRDIMKNLKHHKIMNSPLISSKNMTNSKLMSLLEYKKINNNKQNNLIKINTTLKIKISNKMYRVYKIQIRVINQMD